LPQIDPDAPGTFRHADPDRLYQDLSRAGFRIDRAEEVDVPVMEAETGSDLIEWARAFGLTRLLSGLPNEIQLAWENDLVRAAEPLRKDGLIRLEHENAQLKKAVLGSRSEKSKMPRIKTGAPPTAEEQQKTRRERAAVKAQAPTVTVNHKVADAERRCATCGNEKLDPLGEGKKTTVWEFVPARFVRVEHVQEVCAAGATASLSPRPAPRRSSRRGNTAPRFSLISP
jgi:hypothetical protein